MKFSVVLLLAAAAMLEGCPPRPIAISQSGTTMSQLLGPSWVIVPLPDSKLTPGSIIQITPVPGNASAVDLRWLGNLQSCGVPNTPYLVSPGGVPGITSNSSIGLDANVSGTVLSASGSANANLARSAVLTLTDVGDDSLDTIKFRTWFAVPSNNAAFNNACGQVTMSPNVYLIEEALVVSKGKLEFKNDAGLKVSITPPAGAKILSAGFSPNITNDGTLEVTQPTTFAIKRMQQINANTWATLGAPGAIESNDVGVLSGKTIHDVTGP